MRSDLEKIELFINRRRAVNIVTCPALFDDEFRNLVFDAAIPPDRDFVFIFSCIFSNLRSRPSQRFQSKYGIFIMFFHSFIFLAYPLPLNFLSR